MTSTTATGEHDRARLSTTISYFAAFVALGLAYASLGPTLTDLAAQVGVGLQEISYVLSARGLGYLAGSVLGGRLYDSVKGHPVMAGMLGLIAIALVVIPLAPALWLLIALILLLGAFEGALDVGANTLVVWVHGDRVDPYMNALHFFFGVGAFISPIIIAQAVLLSGGIRSAYWVLAVLMLPVAIVVLRQPSPSAASQLGGSSAANAAPTDAARAADGREGGALGSRQDVTLVLLIALFFFLYVGAESSLGGWIATYAKTIGLGSSDPQAASATAAYLTAAFWGAVTLGRLFSIPLAAHFSPRRVLSADLIGCVVSAAVLLAWPGNPVATWVGTLGAGLSMASIFPTSLSLAERHLPITGTITSVFFVGASLGGVSVPWLVGQFFERVGPHVTIAAISAAVVLSALVFAVILVHTKRAERSFRHV